MPLWAIVFNNSLFLSAHSIHIKNKTMKKINLITFLVVLVFSFNGFSQAVSKKTNSKTMVLNTNDYAAFGEKFAPNKVLSNKEMLKKYKTLKKGDSISVKFKTTIKEVCKKKGCWMSLDLTDNKESFVKFKDYAFFVPLNANNSEAIVNGVAFIEIVPVDELRHYAKDGGKSAAEIKKITKPEIKYAFTATGVLIKK